MVNIEFVPYELSLKLKAIGFDEPCLAIYRRGSLYGTGTSVNRYYEDGDWKLEKNSDYTGALNQWVAAPTFSQAFRWFREKHGFDLNWKPMSMVGITCYYDIEIHHPKYVWDKPPKAIGKTHDEAELECLVKLIEIVESKSE
jgi:hypothetical protein